MSQYEIITKDKEKILVYGGERIKVLIAESELQDKVKELGERITKDYTGRDLVIISVLRGSFIFLADICREIKMPVIFDFMAVSSYGDSKVSSGIVRITKDLEFSIEGKEVLIIEDIVDSGRTLNYLVKKKFDIKYKIFQVSLGKEMLLQFFLNHK